jgi:hypothetical protein
MVKAPDFAEGKPYPSAGELIGPAWAAIWQFLKVHTDEWHAGTEIIFRLGDKIPCNRRTALGLLYNAANAGILDAQTRAGGTPKRHRVEYKISSKYMDWEPK